MRRTRGRKGHRGSKEGNEELVGKREIHLTSPCRFPFVLINFHASETHKPTLFFGYSQFSTECPLNPTVHLRVPFCVSSAKVECNEEK